MANTKTRKLYLKDNIVKILLLVIVVWFFGALAVNQMQQQSGADRGNQDNAAGAGG